MIYFRNPVLNLTVQETLDQFDDDLWVELILKSPQSVKNICMMLSLDLQMGSESLEKFKKEKN